MKNVAFADVSDGSSAASMAVVMPPHIITNLATGASVKFKGILRQSPAKGQAVELEVVNESDIELYGRATADYPLQKKFHTPEFLRKIPQFRWKGATYSSVLRYRSYAIRRMMEFFESKDFVQVNSPILTSSDCEGAGEVFNVRSGKDEGFFDKPAYLTVSSQLHLEVYAAALGRVWNLAPAFRAEKSDTNRHLSEFWMLEAELAFTDCLDDVMSVAEGMIRAAVPVGKAAEDLLLSRRSPELRQTLSKRWEMLSSPNKWPRISYREALSILKDQGKENVTWQEGLSTEHEKFLAKEVFRGPVFVTDYPTEQKPFYMKASIDSDKTVACFDLLVPEMGELIGGSLREDNYEVLVASMENHSMDVQDLDWYVDLRKQGSFPHGGYGMGFERLVSFVCGVENVREAIGFPRWYGSCVC
jgi:asparaginyl-tRNA synthetase